LLQIGISIGGIGKDNDAARESLEHALESGKSSTTIGKRREGFAYLLDARVLEDVHSLPISDQAFQEVVPLDVTVIVGARHIRGIDINQVEFARRYLQKIAQQCPMAPPTVENAGVENGHLLLKMLAQG